ncbi:putative kinase inhibitor [Aquisphaera giovannonii]|uniref:Putative kinase inhibitor n=1 Tax=Aquisphaera giovannonii TaxID=406548 RepID=A0A5B9W2S6_9BACT|nr:YbhB/YbcL family Raf kinase inhibitor-like protein [Aquisphaera giovannonii]QEH34882.1 putative kinase inhibitor [Aquisphaera giovannonii]
MPRDRNRRIAPPVRLGVLTLLGWLLAGCGGGGGKLPPEDASRMKIQLKSRAFADGAAIPREYTCDGADRSPPLEWSGVPAASKSLSLIVDDPDAPAGTWSHWVAYDIDPAVSSLRGGIPADEPSFRQGTNDFGKPGYGGPCPPSGTHHYHFRLYALDRRLDLPAGATRRAVLDAVAGHILAEGRLIGTYAR